MHRFELVKNDPKKVKLEAGTRAGFLIAAMQGVFAVAGAVGVEGGDMTERPFRIDASDFIGLMASFLSQATALANEQGEKYDEVRFDLITDKKATGAFSGRKMQHVVSIPTVRLETIEIRKGDTGWEGALETA